MGPRRSLGMLLAGLSLMVPVSAGAEIYRWTDAEGRVHFSDEPPERGARDLRTMDLPRASGEPDPELQQARERGRRLLEAWDAERAAAEEAAQGIDEREQRCAELRAHLEDLEGSRFVMRPDEASGVARPLDTGEREAYERGLRELLAEHCG